MAKDETDKTNKDTSLVGDKASVGKEGTTPSAYTKAQVDKMILDAKSEWGREVAPIKEASKRLSLLEQERNEWLSEKERLLKEKDELELAAARDNPEAFDVIKGKQTNRTKEAEIKKKEMELRAKELEHSETLTRLEQFNKQQKAIEIASGYEGVDASVLLSVTDGTPEKMKALAEVLGKPKVEAGQIKPDSGVGVGYSMTWDRIQKEFAEHPYNPSIRAEYLKQRIEKGIPL